MIVAFTVFSAALLVVALGLLLRARRQVLVSGTEHLLGAAGVVETFRGEQPMVRLEGELWQARSEQPLAVADEVTVEAVDELVLSVRKREGEIS